MSTSLDLNEISEVLKTCFEDKSTRVFLFGSRAAGTARYNSDWDIGVLTEHPVPGHVMTKVRDSLDSIRTLDSFDLVDFNKVSASFRNVAMRKMIPLLGGDK